MFPCLVESPPFYSIEDGSVRLGYSRNPTQCVIVLVLRLVAGLLRPRLSFSKLSKALSSGKVSGSATTVIQYF
jgi:hypothetical protein